MRRLLHGQRLRFSRKVRSANGRCALFRVRLPHLLTSSVKFFFLHSRRSQNRTTKIFRLISQLLSVKIFQRQTSGRGAGRVWGVAIDGYAGLLSTPLDGPGRFQVPAIRIIREKFLLQLGRSHRQQAFTEIFALILRFRPSSSIANDTCLFFVQSVPIAIEGGSVTANRKNCTFNKCVCDMTYECWFLNTTTTPANSTRLINAETAMYHFAFAITPGRDCTFSVPS